MFVIREEISSWDNLNQNIIFLKLLKIIFDVFRFLNQYFYDRNLQLKRHTDYKSAINNRELQ